VLNLVGMGAEVGGSDPAASTTLTCGWWYRRAGHQGRRVGGATPGSSSGTTLLQPADDKLSPLIRPSPPRIRPWVGRIRPCSCPIRPCAGFQPQQTRSRW